MRIMNQYHKANKRIQWIAKSVAIFAEQKFAPLSPTNDAERYVAKIIMKTTVATFLSFFLPYISCSGFDSTYDAVVAGKKCQEDKKNLFCSYSL